MTSSTPATPGPVRAEPPSRFSPTNVLLGLILLTVGIVWLLQSTDIVDVSWYVVMAAVLVVVGIGLVIGSATGEQSGLITIGIILTAVLTLASWTELQFEGGVGDKTVEPATIENVEPSYGLIAGTLTLDLRDLDFPNGQTEIEVRVAAGRLIIVVPESVGVSTEWRIGAGQIELFDRIESGLLLDDFQASTGFDSAAQQLILDLTVLTGQIEVRR